MTAAAPPGGDHVAPVLQPLARWIAAHREAGSVARDPDLVRRMQATPMRLLETWFPAEVRGLENIPVSGPVLVVANHSCLFWMPDAWIVADAVAHRRGSDALTYGLAYDLLFAIPAVGPVLRRLGGIPADPQAAADALYAGAAVVVFPGGDHDACRPWTDRDRVDFGEHRGFVRLALRCGVPVVPVVAHGAHHATVVLARGEPLARRLGLPGVRVNVLPVVLGPLGATPILSLPTPAKITVAVLPALDWSRYGPEGAGDRGIVEACFAEVMNAMQDAMTRLKTEHPHPVAEGIVQFARQLATLSRAQS